MGDIGKMFDPKTVAVIGELEVEGSVEKTLVNNLLASDRHKTFLVNVQSRSDLHIVKERKCRRTKKTFAESDIVGKPTTDFYLDVADIPEKIDLAVVTGPAPTVPDIVEACGKAGVEGVIILSRGFKEAGDEGRELEEAIRDIRNKYGMRILGPNCAGIIRPDVGLNASIFELQPERGNIAFISQSASLGSTFLDWAGTAHIGFSVFVSPGSMIDIDFGDLIDFLGEDPKTRSIVLYMETVGNARKFMGAARGFARNKPIIVVKPGRFKESAKAALSHTGSMAGYDAAYDVAFRRAGVVRVKEISDLFNVAQVLQSQNLPKGPRLAIITNAGGPGIMATDALVGLGGELARLSQKSIDALSTFLPPHRGGGNPVDLFGDADIERYVKAIGICMGDPEVDGVLVIYTSHKAARPIELAEAINKIAGETHKPLITTWMGTKDVQEGREILRQNNILSYEKPEEAIKTYLYMYTYKKNLELLYETPAELSVDQAPPKYHLKAFVRRVAKEERTVLSEAEAKDFLKNYGIPITTPFFTSTAESAANWAARVGYPVVLKVVSPDVIHRSDVGGTAMVYSETRLKPEYEMLVDRVRDKLPGARISGVTVEQMIEDTDYQLMLGVKKDNDFGSIILFGMGGKDAEVLTDYSFGLPPINQSLARLLMEDTRIYRVLKASQAKRPVDLRELEQIIVSFSNLIVDFPEISEVDINPIVISKGKAHAVNARIILEENRFDPAIQYPHLVIPPYPTRFITRWGFSDGTEVVLRPIKPEDEPLEHELLTSLSEASLRGRFFSIIKDITHEMLIRYCNIDYDREIAIVAETREEGKRKMIGIGRLIMDRELKVGEFAVVVHDNYHGKGLGYKLVDLLIGIAEEKRLEGIYGHVLAENRKMLDLCRKLGFTMEATYEDITRVNMPLV